MFTLLRYGLTPVVLFCVVIVAASVDAYSTNAIRKSTWAQTVATVVHAQDFGQALAKLQGKQNTFPDPHGTLQYVIDGKSYAWQGRGRDIGVTAMNPGDQISLYYNPQNPREISTLVLLGASTGNLILAAALAFLAFYVWFFWLRGFLRRSGPGDFDGGVTGAFAGRLPERLSSQIERPRSAFGDRARGATFGKR